MTSNVAGVPRYLVAAALSLCAALVVLVAAVYLWSWNDNRAAGLSSEHWGPGELSVLLGEGAVRGEYFSLRTDARGKAGLNLRPRALALEDFALLELELDRYYPGLQLELLWISRGTGGQTLTHVLDEPSGSTVTVNLNALRVWRGDMTAIGLLLTGRSGETVNVQRLSLLPPSGYQAIARVLHDWTGFRVWNGSSINLNWGSLSLAHIANPPPVTAALMALAMLLLFGYYRLVRRTAVDWRALAAVFLAGWFALDMLWQTKLLRQLAETHKTFAGRSFAEKLAAGSDAALAGFAAEIKRRLPAEKTRLLVGSTADYRGMRVAYYLYPHNVLWQRGGPEVPPAAQLRSGDFIVLTHPTGVGYDPRESTLLLEDAQTVTVEPVMSHAAGYLYRVP
mgnify:CR=1 FL=1